MVVDGQSAQVKICKSDYWVLDNTEIYQSALLLFKNEFKNNRYCIFHLFHVWHLIMSRSRRHTRNCRNLLCHWTGAWLNFYWLNEINKFPKLEKKWVPGVTLHRKWKQTTICLLSSLWFRWKCDHWISFPLGIYAKYRISHESIALGVGVRAVRRNERKKWYT